MLNKTSIAAILGTSAIALLKAKGSASSNLRKYRIITNVEDLLNCPENLKSQVYSVKLRKSREIKAPFKGVVLPDDVFKGMDNIHSIDISEADNVPSSILDLPNLKWIIIAPEKDTGEIPSIVFQLENLTDLAIKIFNRNPYPNVYALALNSFEPLVISKNIQNLKNLKVLSIIDVILSNNWMPEEIINLNNLFRINLNIPGMIINENRDWEHNKWYLPEFITQIPNLEWIDVSDSSPYNGIPYGFIHKIIQMTIGQWVSHVKEWGGERPLSSMYTSEDGIDVKKLIDINIKIAELSKPRWNYGTQQYENKKIRLGPIYPPTIYLMIAIGVPRNKIDLLVEYSEKLKPRQNVVKLRKL